MLASSCPRAAVSMYPPKCSLSRGWCYVEERKSPQDISEFPQQFVDALQEPACRRIRKSDACSLVARPGGSFCLSAERSVGQCLCRLAGTSGVLSASSLVPSVARGERKEGLYVGDTRAYTLQCSDTLLSAGEKTFFRPIKSVFLYAPPLLLFQYRLPWVDCVWIVSGQGKSLNRRRTMRPATCSSSLEGISISSFTAWWISA